MVDIESVTLSAEQKLQSTVLTESSSVFLSGRLEVDVSVHGNLRRLHRAGERVWEAAEVCSSQQRKNTIE